MRYNEMQLTEYLAPRAIGRGVPLMGNFELTARCSLNCRMCYVRQSAADVAARGGELSAAQWLSVAQEARDKGMLYLLLTGGEPLIRPDFREIYTELRKMGLAISINTNGTLINDEYIEFFRHNPPARINMSLYGASPAAYERLCGDGEAFEKTMYALRGLKNAGVKLKLSMSLTPYNKDDLESVAKISQEEKVYLQVGTYMFPAVRKDKSHVGENDRLTEEEAALTQLKYDRIRFDDERFMLRAERMMKNETEREAEGCGDEQGERLSCRAGRCAFWITWQGKMVPCGMMIEPYTEPLKTGFADAWDELRRRTGEIRMPYECGVCSYRGVCDACPAACYAETGSFSERPEYPCKKVKELLRITAEEYRRIKEKKSNEA